MNINIGFAKLNKKLCVDSNKTIKKTNGFAEVARASAPNVLIFHTAGGGIHKNYSFLWQ